MIFVTYITKSKWESTTRFLSMDEATKFMSLAARGAVCDQYGREAALYDPVITVLVHIVR
jgi:hypothetical protein